MAEASGSRQVVIADGDTSRHAGPRHGPRACASPLVARGRRLDLAPSSGRHAVLPAVCGAVIGQGRLEDTIER